MKTIAIISQKGGAGKTTLAVHLAVEAAGVGLTVALIDLDPQATAAQWADWRHGEGPTVVAIPHGRLTAALKEARTAGVDLIVIDTPPAADSAAVAAARVADLVLVPTRPAAFDLHAVKTTAELMRVTQTPAYAVLNAVPPRASLLIDEVAMVILACKLMIAPVALTERADYRHSVTDGLTVGEFSPDGKAAVEVKNFFSWACLKLDLVTRLQDHAPTRGLFDVSTSLTPDPSLVPNPVHAIERGDGI